MVMIPVVRVIAVGAVDECWRISIIWIAVPIRIGIPVIIITISVAAIIAKFKINAVVV